MKRKVKTEEKEKGERELTCLSPEQDIISWKCALGWKKERASMVDPYPHAVYQQSTKVQEHQPALFLGPFALHSIGRESFKKQEMNF